MNHAELYETINVVKKLLRENPDPNRLFTCANLTRPFLEGLLDYLYSFDPDMPPRPICKALGPLVGDMMMNDKLNRLDRIANSLGPTMVRLGMIADQMDRRG